MQSFSIKNAVHLCVGLVVARGGLAAHAMTLEVQGSTVFATGRVDEDYGKFQKALAAPGVQRVVFVNSPGGDLWTGMQIGRLIADKGVDTVAAGYCVSACSIMFMGGKERSFSDALPAGQTYVGIHGPHDKDTSRLSPTQSPQIYAFFKQRMGERFNADVMNKALYSMESAGALLKVFDGQRPPKQAPLHCKSEQSLRKDCIEFKELDALSLGVVTKAALTSVELPASFKLGAKIFGQEPTQELADAPAFFKGASEKLCSNDKCRKLFDGYMDAHENKAIAVSVGADHAVGTAIKRDNAATAFVGAIYGCNHIKDQPTRLCEALVVNGYDIRDFYATGMASHAEALSKLAAPSAKYYADEEYGGGMTSANGLRTQKLHGITPQKLDGIRTYGTQELALALKSPQPPAVVDVWAGGGDAIPSAQTLWRGGLAFDEAEPDAAYEARFIGLLRLLSPDANKPVVFYCMSRDCWLSANAAMRARKLGYTQVGWYRGGMESWKAANLPVARIVVRAVVQ